MERCRRRPREGAARRRADHSFAWSCPLIIAADVYQIDNLVGFEALTTLRLDNNTINKLENIGHLVNLQWLGACRRCAIVHEESMPLL